MVKIFNNNLTTFMLCADDGSTKIVPPKGFAEIEDKFTGDITYRNAVSHGIFTPFESAKQGDAAERNAHEGGKGGKKKAAADNGESENAESETK